MRRHGKGAPVPAVDWAQFQRHVYWMHFAEGSLMSLMLIARFISCIPEAKDTRCARMPRAWRTCRLRRWRFADKEYFAGEFSAADVMMVFLFTTMRRYPSTTSPYANIGKPDT